MDHNETITALESQLQEINASGDPEGVLLKYAAANNLAPAQLEKLGHVFNTAKTVAHLDRGEDRAASFPLLDVDGMLSKYAAPMERPSARLDESGSEWYDKAAGVKAASAAKAATCVAELARPEEQPQSEETEEDVSAVLKRAAGMRREMSYVVQIMEDFRDAGHAKLAALRAEDPETLVEDVYDSLGGEGLSALGYTLFAKTASAFDPETTGRRLARDRTGALGVVKEAMEDLETSRKALLYGAGMLEQLNADLVKAAAGTAIPSRNQEAQAARLDRFAGGRGYNHPGKTVHTQERRRQDTAPEPETAAPLTADDLELALAMMGRGYAHDGDSLLDVLGRDMEGFGKGVDEVGEWLPPSKELRKNLAQKAKGFGSRLSQNHRRKNAILDHNEVNEQAALALQQLMITDPVISEYDEDTVVEVANALHTLNPAITRDPVLLRTTLREALQYDSAVPLHLQSELSKLYESIRKGRETGAAARRGKEGGE